MVLFKIALLPFEKRTPSRVPIGCDRLSDQLGLIGVDQLAVRIKDKQVLLSPVI
ncbi:hypothetical protein D1872_347360 [compost metagenome]